PIPGASAVLAAVVASGVAGPHWAFEGFLPRTGRDRRERLQRIADDERGTIVFEAPGRVAATLADLVTACGAERPGAVCRELTKLHETVERGPLGDLAALALAGRILARGEFVLVIGAWLGGRSISGEAEADALGAARTEVERLVADGLARGDAARRVSGTSGVPRRKLYGAGTLE
nr:16S rRNA (cytidine(1402)-2'-O)-methyltransferase [Chloroflexota bacterium]